MLGAIHLRTAQCTRTWRSDGLIIGRKLAPTVPEDRYDEQPLHASDSRYVVVADLRLDNRRDLARELSLGPDELSRMSDAALAALSLERWQEAAFQRFVGVFAIAAWDTREHRLLLARDFVGGRPLFYHAGDDFLAFASMPSGLHALPSIPRGADRQAMAEALALILPESPRSAYQGVQRVMPGHVCVVDANGGARQSAFWRPNLEPLRFKRPDDYADGLRHHLDQAVEAQLRGAEGRVATHLSGGFDSAAVTTAAARLMRDGGGTVTAFTACPREGYVSPGEKLVDEGPLAAATAALYPNIEHVVVRSRNRSALDNLDRTSTIYGGPMFNLFNMTWADEINDEAKARGLKVLLTGATGNATVSFDGGAALPELLSSGRFAGWFRIASALRRRKITGWRGITRVSVEPFLPGYALAALWRLSGYKRIDLRRATALRPGELQRIYANAAAERTNQLAFQSLDAWDRSFANGQKERLAMLSGDRGPVNKGVFGWWGLDMRDPTADRRLVEFSLRIPTEAFIHDGQPKALARAVLAGRVAPELLDAQRRGLQAADWHEDLTRVRERLRDEVERIEFQTDARELIDVERLRGLVSNWPAGDWNSIEVSANYRLAMLRAISVANFIGRASGSNH